MIPSRQILTRRHALAGLLLLASPLLTSTAAWASDCPERTIRMIVPSARRPIGSVACKLPIGA